VGVKSNNGRFWVRLRQQQCRCAVAATDVGNTPAVGQFVVDAVERRDPLARQVVEVAGPKEALAPAEDVLVLSSGMPE
jgi:hypothetical protein